MSFRKKFSIITMLCVLTLILIAPVNVKAATLGQKSTAPDAGWATPRTDDTDKRIIYEGSGWNSSTANNPYGGTCQYTNSSDGIIKFKFKGTKIRLIFSKGYETVRGNNYINIDGNVESYTQISSTYDTQLIVYEKTGLSDDIHTVQITNPDGKLLGLDGIDLDVTGYLCPFSPTNLTAVASTTGKSVTLNWTEVPNASGYNIYRTETPGTGYSTPIISTPINATNYPDNDPTLKNGHTYYYVVTAIVSNIESTYSNEASAKIIGNNAVLEITMTNGNIKEYDMTADEIDNFLTWYDTCSIGTGRTYYIITKNYNVRPFISRKEYLAFKKISSFEVKEYN